MSSKIWIASKTVVPNESGHLYLVYDPDGNPESGDEYVWNGYPSDYWYGIVPFPNGNVEIENWVPIGESKDDLGSSDPFDDRNYTEVDTGTKTPEQVKDDLSDFAEELGATEGETTETDIPYTVPIEIHNGEQFPIPATNSNTAVKSGLEKAGISLDDNLPEVGGEGSGNGRFHPDVFPGAESFFSGGDGEYDIPESDKSQIIYNEDGNNTYNITPNPFGTGQIIIVEDDNTSTIDRINLHDIDPEDVILRKTPEGNLEIYFPWDANGEPSIVIPRQWDGMGIPKINTLWIYPEVGDPVAIPLNNDEDFPIEIPSPSLELPEWLNDLFDDWVVAEVQSSPLVLDLDGNGIDLASVSGSGAVYWDIDEDGLAETSGWISGNDGLLAIDLNSDGKINDHSELFGTEITDGFTVLSAFDSDSNNVIDDSDTQFDDLLVWVDSNSNGYSESTELSTLAELGITSINLSASLVDYEIAGNHITHESTFTMNGQTRTIVDAWFAYDNTDSRYLGEYSFDLAAFLLPNVRGFGDVSDLRVSMSTDSELRDMVQELLVTESNELFDNAFNLHDKIEAIIFRWSGVDTVSPSSRGAYVDAQKLEALEKFLGDDYLQFGTYSNPIGGQAGDAIEALFEKFSTQVLFSILIHTDSSFFDPSLVYDSDTGEISGADVLQAQFSESDENVVAHDFDDIYILQENTTNSVFVQETATGGHDEIWINGSLSDVGMWVSSATLNIELLSTSDVFQFSGVSNNASDIHERIEIIRFSDGTSIDLTNGLQIVDTNDAHDNRGTNLADTIDGRGGNDTIWGYDGDDILTGGTGYDVLRGGTGNDTYVWNIGDGNDYIADDAGSLDILSLGDGISLSDLTFQSSGNSLNITAFGDTLSIEQFYSVGRIGAIEEIHFSDSTTLDLVAHLNRAPDAYDDAFSSYEDDVVTGNLLANNGSGSDYDPDGDALTVTAGTFSTTNGSITILADGDFTYTPDTSFTGSDSYTYTITDALGATDTATITFAISEAPQSSSTIVGTASSDNLYGDQSGVENDTIEGLAGDDTLYGYSGNDAYVWDVGDGNDIINESGGIDQLVLHNVLESDIRIEKSGNFNLKINIGSEYITVNSQYMSDYYNSSSYDQYQVERILLDDSTVIDLTTYTTLVGTSSSDNLTGFNVATTFVGEGGADTLYGQSNGDTYVWDVGDGNDIINETGGVDQLVLHNVLESDIRIEKSGNFNLKINIGSEYITVNSQYMSDYYNSSSYDQYQVESILLDDNTVIDLTAFSTLVGTSSSDNITGFNVATTFVGEGGDDTLYGKASGDTYVWDVGDGNDIINETGGIDQLVLHNVLESDIRIEKSGNFNLKINIGSEYITVNSQYMSDYYNSSSYDQYQVESILLDDSTVIDLTTYSTLSGTSSNDSLTGFNVATTFVGEGGDDTLYGKSNGDTYVWDVGDGNDTINEAGGTDQLVLHNVLASDIRLEVSGTHNLKVHVGSESITINSQYMSDYYQTSSYDQYQVESILLDDSTTISLLGNLSFAGTSGGETIYGLNSSDVISGLGGNDTLHAKAGDDTLYGGDGSDYLYGNDGDDVLYGGAGVDMLYGNAGADIFVFDDIASSDNIQDFDLTAGDKLDVSDLLIGYDPLTDAITDFVQITESGGNSYLNVDADGGADNFVQVAYIYNETGLTDEDALETSGNLIAA